MSETFAYAHPNGAIWRLDNFPAGIDFQKDGWFPLYRETPAPHQAHKQTLFAVLAAKMPDGCTVQDYLEDAIPGREDIAALGISVEGYGLSDIRNDIHQDFYRLLVHTIIEAARPSPSPNLAALEKINAIRNSIIGCQTVNWSEHIYPLVAALEEAGIEGDGYPASRANVGTMLDRTLAAENEASALRAALKTAVGHVEHMANFIGTQRLDYSFENLGKDMPGLKAAATGTDR